MRILIIGGNRFFGKHLVKNLLRSQHKVTLLNRGNADDGFGPQVQRIKADRNQAGFLAEVTRGQKWDLIYDQVCYTAEQARSACEIFKDKTARYCLTSSASVYDKGENHEETEFSPGTYSFTEDADPTQNYQAAKRQAESVFQVNASFNLVIVRPCLVVGTDDYTQRLKWHIERIQKGLPMYFPHLDASHDYISSEQAGSALEVIGLSSFSGAVNCAAPQPLSLRALIKLCESVAGRKAVVTESETPENHSPYGFAHTSTLNINQLAKLGFSAPPTTEWLPALIAEIHACL